MFVRPKEAATIILLRRREERPAEGFEVLMVLRSGKSKFVPSAYVFPGGALDEEDCAPEMASLCRGLSLSRAYETLEHIPSPALALGAWVAGIRETFEEVGLLLAGRQEQELLAFDGDNAKRFQDYRPLLQQKKITFREILQKENLMLAADRLHYFSHWITPWFLPIRYDVRFFAAESPAGQEARHDGIELTGHLWLTPQEALRRYHENRFEMVFPTLMTMKDLSRFRTVRDVLQSTRNRTIEAESG